MTATWDVLRAELESLCFQRPISDVARAIPAARSTVYNWLNGAVTTPSLANRANVERLVQQTKSKVGQSGNSGV